MEKTMLVINGKEIGMIKKEYATMTDSRAFDIYDLEDGFTVTVRRTKRKLCDLVTDGKTFIELKE